jgi:hypothetical protein
MGFLESSPDTATARYYAVAYFSLSTQPPSAEVPPLEPIHVMEVLRLSGSSGLRRFVDAPWQILDADAHPQWIPPLRMSVRALLDPKKNPFFQNAERALFLAVEDGRSVGRVAAIRNGWSNEVRDDRAGFFGFFECGDRPDAARALLEASEGWLREDGCDSVVGPWNPSTNYEGGILVSGFEHHQTFLTSWNPPYYPELLEGAGYRKAKDLFAWHLHLGETAADLSRRFETLSHRVMGKLGLEFGPLDLSDFEAAMRQCWNVYCESWSGNWGFTPLAVGEWLFIAHEMKDVMVKDGMVAVRADGELVGFGLFLPDYNRAILKARSGRLLPLNWLRILRARRHTPWVRTMLTGILPRYQGGGVLPLILYEAVRQASTFGVEDVEFSWILEDNEPTNGALENIGASLYRSWRIYERAL